MGPDCFFSNRKKLSDFEDGGCCLRVGSEEVCDDLVEGLVARLGQVSVLGDLVEQGALRGLDVLHELLLEVGDL